MGESLAAPSEEVNWRHQASRPLGYRGYVAAASGGIEGQTRRRRGEWSLTDGSPFCRTYRARHAGISPRLRSGKRQG
jgi:hypothetical protein